MSIDKKMYLYAENTSTQPTLESCNAAFLLLNLKALANRELCKSTTPKISGIFMQSCLIPSPEQAPRSLVPSDEDESSDSGEASICEGSGPKNRLRTVSVASQDGSPYLSPLRRSPSPNSMTPNSQFSSTPIALNPQESLSSSQSTDLTSVSSDAPRDDDSQDFSSSFNNGKCVGELFSKPPSTKLVGTTANAPIKEVLKRKFSWKNYPELEAYLVENRDQYLQYSSQLNYTSEQKHYNNRLTQGLLDLASSEGYVFEDFTFAAIRDRIRCYYKSFVQAIKKKKRKKRAFY